MIYSNSCVYLRDDTQSAALLAYHLPGGFHRLMNTSRYADWRTSSGFAQFRPEQSSVETAQSRRVSCDYMKTVILTYILLLIGNFSYSQQTDFWTIFWDEKEETFGFKDNKRQSVIDPKF